MAGPNTVTASWTAKSLGHGILEVDLQTWDEFYIYVQKELLPQPSYLFRGQRMSTWSLESGLDRLIRRRGGTPEVSEHLLRFKKATLGRRGTNPPHIADDNDWWALGQHNGLATPLLDWTASPFVAAYFAFIEEDSGDQTDRRLVYALNEDEIMERSAVILARHKLASCPPIIEFVRPQLDENARLISHKGHVYSEPRGRRY